MIKRVIFHRHHGLHSPGEVAGFAAVAAARLVAAGIAVWHPEDAPAVAAAEHAVERVIEREAAAV